MGRGGSGKSAKAVAKPAAPVPAQLENGPPPPGGCAIANAKSLRDTSAVNPDLQNFNSGHYVRLMKNWNNLLGHPMFANLVDSDALDFRNGTIHSAHIAPLDIPVAISALQAKGTFVGGSCLLWANPFYSATPGMPLNLEVCIFLIQVHVTTLSNGLRLCHP